MRIFTTLILFVSFHVNAQVEYLNIEKYRECEVEIPIKHSLYAQESDKRIANNFKDQELIIIDTKSNGKIKKTYRGYIGIYEKSNQMATFFEPIESIISFDEKYTVYLLYNSKNTYCYDAQCFDEKNGIKEISYTFRCPTEVKESKQFYGNGILSQEMKRHDLAVKWFELSISKDKEFCDAWNELGNSHFFNGNHELSYKSYINALVIDSAFATPWLNLYELFIFNQDTSSAAQSLESLFRNVDKSDYDYSKYNDIFIKIN